MQMDVEKIVTYGNEVLRARAEEVTEFNQEIKDLIELMYEAMVKYNGVGLAAPQIGVSKRVFVYDVGEGQHALINPEILSMGGGEEYAIEGCLSIPGLQGEVPRAERVVVKGINEEGKPVKIKGTGLLARVFQHETDHLNGTLFVDRADEDTLETVRLKPDDGESEEGDLDL